MLVCLPTLLATATPDRLLAQGGSTIRYVNASNPTPVSPYTNWSTAAVTIQEAVDVALPGDEIVVTNGTYATGGRVLHGTMNNRVAVDRPVTVRSVAGPEFTVIRANQFNIRCVYLTNGAVLAGFTLRGGRTRTAGDVRYEQSGGGAFCESAEAVVSDCVFTANTARIFGGGAYSGTLINCAFSGNSCQQSGGGAAFSALDSCIISVNSATWGGGASHSSLRNCWIVGNSARDPSGARMGEGGGAYSSSLTNCVLTNNYARVSGGGAAWGSLYGCLLVNNSALQGGGAAADLLVNCTVVGNSAPTDGGVGGGVGGGLLGGTIINSIVVQNTAWTGQIENFRSSTFSNSCTWPDPGGTANITDDPAFVDYQGGNYRLRGDSGCINTGSNGAVTITVDLEGRPRIVDQLVDMGAFEYVPSPRISVPFIASGRVHFSFHGFGGIRYVIQYKDRLHDSSWLELDRHVGADASVLVRDDHPILTSRFYRIKIE